MNDEMKYPESTLALERPDYFYDGAVPDDEDEFDYIKPTLRGEVIA